MTCKIIITPLVVLTVFTAPLMALAQTQRPIHVAQGVEFTQTITKGSIPLVVNLLKVDLHRRGVTAFVGQAYDGITADGKATGRQSVEDIAAAHHAVAGVNADFFPWTGRPLDLAIHEGRVYSFPYGGRPAIGFTNNGTAVMDQLSETCTLTMKNGSKLLVSGIDKPSGVNSAVLYTSYYHLPILARGSAIALTIDCASIAPYMHRAIKILAVQRVAAGEKTVEPGDGDMVLLVTGDQAKDAQRVAAGDDGTITAELQRYGGSSQSPIWRNVTEAVSGGPWIVRHGEVVPTTEQPGFGLHSFILYHHPRTAVGITANGNLILAVVDGRSSLSSGMSLAQLGQLMKQQGAVEAMNLDGGGSSVMVVRGRVVNMPSDGTSRLVANSILISAPAMLKRTQSPSLDFTNPPTPITAGETVTLQATGDPGLWGTSHGVGFVTQGGAFTSFVAGQTTVIAGTGKGRTHIQLTVTPSTVNHLRASLVRKDSYTSTLTVHAYDLYGNSVAGVPIVITTTPALPAATLTTDSQGVAAANITWPNGSPDMDLVTAAAHGAPPVVLHRSSQKQAKSSAPQALDPDNRKAP